MTTPETWRVVLDDGTVREVSVEARDGTIYATIPEAFRDETWGNSERETVTKLAGEQCWSVVEIRAPGEPTTDERIVAAVAAETARCVGILLSPAMREHYAMLGPRAFQVAADAMKRGA